MNPDTTRLDHRIIFEIIEPGARVLDLGCGTGELMFILANEKNAKVQGIELNNEAIYRCVEKGLSVFHSDIDSGLTEYPDKSFDYVILNQSLQEVRKAEFVIDEALRVGKKIIVGFPNFANFKARSMLFFRGKAPITASLPYRWYDSPNVRFLSISDFKDFCLRKGIRILNVRYFTQNRLIKFFPNLFAVNSIFVLAK
jgi:methionine biosynthesis protein MetW